MSGLRACAFWIAFLGMAAPVAAGVPIQVTIRGQVDFNQIDEPPLSNAAANDQATLSFRVDSDVFIDSVLFPVRGYEIDTTSFQFAAGPAVVGMPSPFPAGETPYFVLRNDDPAVDGFFLGSAIDGFPNGVPLDQEGIFGAFRASFHVTYDGDPLPSLDILDALGTYDFAGLTVFGWTVDDGGFDAMGLTFESMSIELSTPPAVPDGVGSSPLRVQKVPADSTRLRLLFDTTTCQGGLAYHLVYGWGSDLPGAPGGALAVQGSACGVPGSPFNWVGVPEPVPDPSGLLWFLMLASDASTTEGAWGNDSADVERQGPGPGGSSAECGITSKDLSNACGH